MGEGREGENERESWREGRERGIGREGREKEEGRERVGRERKRGIKRESKNDR